MITEICPSNQTNLENAGEYPDWIELYNPTNTPIDLAGHYLTDQLSIPNQWPLPKHQPSTP